MIIYNQAFDYYHAIYRFIRLLRSTKFDNYIEVDRLRIWDFYMLFPEEVHSITVKVEEEEIRNLRKQFVKKKNNPYNQVFDNRKVFEKLRPYQMAALQCLASYGIISRDLLYQNRVFVVSDAALEEYNKQFEPLSAIEQNIITLMTAHFANISMFGKDGLKSRTKLMISKYDV